MAPTLSKYDEKPEVGDLIEIFRGFYQHWGVYVGDGFIVHLAPPSEVPGGGLSSMTSVIADKAIVKKQKLWDVVGSDRWEINNSLDKQYHPRPVHVIVREACEMVGRELPYSVVMSNCEHFANELRYGKAESRQVRVVVQASILTIMIGWFWFVIAYLFRSSKKENKNTESLKS